MRIALLISGRGTTAAAIIAACKSGKLTGVEVACVISSKDVSPKNFSSSEEFGEAILKICKENRVDFIGQYGWLVKTPSNVIKAYKNMMVNQHGGPLDIGRPDFGGEGMYGLRVHAARIAFVRKVERDYWSEATAQRVTEKFDEGAVLKAVQVPILKHDTPEDLAARMLPVEHEAQIDTLRDFVKGTVTEVKRESPLILPGEESILAEVKKEAIMRYPKG